MSEEKPSQSFTISGNQFSGGQFGGQAGRDIIQNQQNNVGNGAQKDLTVTEVVQLIAQIRTLFQDSSLPEIEKEKAIKHLDDAKEAVQH